MGRIVIAAYKPKEGKAEELKKLTKGHVPRLRQQGLVTGREVVMMETADGTIVEVFEWLSDEAIAQAHTNPAVLEMWAEYALVCDYVPLNTLSESSMMFAGFTPLN